MYFTTNQTVRERATGPEISLRNFHSFVKAQLLDFSDKSSLLDLGAGRGSEVVRYRKFQHVHALDKDQFALDQLMQRAREVGVGVQTTLADFTRTFKIDRHFSCVSAFSCIHYAENLDVFIDNVANHLAPGGIFVGMCLDGLRVSQALAKVHSLCFTNWARLETGTHAATIRVTIRSIDDKPKEEHLVFWDVLMQHMTQRGFSLVMTGCLTPSQDVKDVHLRKFSSLHRVWVMRFL